MDRGAVIHAEIAAMFAGYVEAGEYDHENQVDVVRAARVVQTRERVRTLHRNRRADGLCQVCGVPSAKSRCGECLAAQVSAEKARRVALAVSGACTRCGDKPARGFKRCAKCKADERRRKARRAPVVTPSAPLATRDRTGNADCPHLSACYYSHHQQMATSAVAEESRGLV